MQDRLQLLCNASPGLAPARAIQEVPQLPRTPIMKLKIVGPALPNIPWEPKPAGNPDLAWRYSANPVVGRRPLPAGHRHL